MKLLIVKEYRTNEKIFYGMHLTKDKKNQKTQKTCWMRVIDWQ